MFDLALAETTQSPESSSGLFAHAFDLDAALGSGESEDPFGLDKRRKKCPSPQPAINLQSLTAQDVFRLMDAVDYDEYRLDSDGLPIFDFEARWLAMPLQARIIKAFKMLDNMYYYQLLRERSAGKAPGKAPKRFTTQYAIDWGRKQGWKLIDREHYDFKNKRHHDCELGTDCIFEDPAGGRIGIQGAGKSERALHWTRFEELGGAAKAALRFLKVIYLEFDRGSKEPIKREDWAI